MTAEVLTDLKENLKDVIPGALLDKLAARLPDSIDGHVAQMMAGMIRQMPAEMPPEQKLAGMMKAMSDKAKQHEKQSGENPGSTKAITRKYYDSLLIEMRLMGAVEPKLETEIFGKIFHSPIMTAALSHLSRFVPGENGKLEQMMLAAKAAGCLAWVGMIENEHFAQCAATGADIVRIIKPYEDDEKIFDQIRQTEALGALAVGMDIDHALTVLGEEDIAVGEKLARKSIGQLRSYVASTSLPFLFKGVLSVHDALIAKEIGAKGIVVSHHGGRMAYTVPPLQMLPDIRKAVGEDMFIAVDCGIISGMDAYKALALGANAVGVGTHLMPILNKDGVEGVARRFEEMRAELKGVMAHTGVADTQSFDPSVIHERRF